MAGKKTGWRLDSESQATAAELRDRSNQQTAAQEGAATHFKQTTQELHDLRGGVGFIIGKLFFATL